MLHQDWNTFRNGMEDVSSGYNVQQLSSYDLGSASFRSPGDDKLCLWEATIERFTTNAMYILFVLPLLVEYYLVSDSPIGFNAIPIQ